MSLLLEGDLILVVPITLPNLQLLDIFELDGADWLLCTLRPGALELDLRLSLHHLNPDGIEILFDFFEQAHIVCLWIFDLGWKLASWFPELPALRVLGLVSLSDKSLSLVGNMVLFKDGAYTARYPTVRTICLSGSGTPSELGRNRMETVAVCYPLKLLNLDRLGLLTPPQSAGGSRDQELQGFLAGCVDRVTLNRVHLQEYDHMDTYVKGLIEESRGP
ncbi:hypothetical protein FRC09_005963 [Ceratobasidium sp. 395]|nr:hypothetical protein FRC09_005963 [Ceratobasidium sp. 395]